VGFNLAFKGLMWGVVGGRMWLEWFGVECIGGHVTHRPGVSRSVLYTARVCISNLRCWCTTVGLVIELSGVCQS
jgi:hypothetical protein